VTDGGRRFPLDWSFMSNTFSPRSAPRWRRGAPAAALVVLALLLAACGSSDGPAGITVGSEDVPIKTINEELNAIAKNKVIASQAAVDGKIRPDVAASWLTTDVQIQVAKQAVERANQRTSDEDRAEALNYANEHFGSEAAFTAFPDWFKARILQQYSFVPAYVRLHTKPPTEQQMRTAYDSSLGQNCASRRYVFRIVTADEATARAAAAEIGNGTDFSQVASRVSTDASSRQQGGALGCLDGQQQLDPTLRSTVDATAVGSVSAPFSTADGWQIVKVDDVGKVLAYDKVKSEIRATLQYGPAGRAALAKTMAKARVKVDPRFGRWVVKDGIGHVEEPKPAATSTTSTPGEPSSTTTTKP
jgi:parvulin-like peptidyl-prolyl isomerase